MQRVMLAALFGAAGVLLAGGAQSMHGLGKLPLANQLTQSVQDKKGAPPPPAAGKADPKGKGDAAKSDKSGAPEKAGSAAKSDKAGAADKSGGAARAPEKSAQPATNEKKAEPKAEETKSKPKRVAKGKKKRYAHRRFRRARLVHDDCWIGECRGSQRGLVFNAKNFFSRLDRNFAV